VKYYQDGRAMYESTGETDRAAAKKFLQRREGAIADAKPVIPRLDRITYDEARADLLARYDITGSRDLREARQRLAHLDAMFAKRRLVTIGPADAVSYTVKRRAEGAADGCPSP
jgi:hypothetical protein